MGCAADGGAPVQDRTYQSVLSCLMNPERSAVRRLLVAWQMGTGKTVGMLRVLDLYATRPEIRDRVLLFPTDALVDSFFQEMAEADNSYRADWLRTTTDSVPTDRPARGRALRVFCRDRGLVAFGFGKAAQRTTLDGALVIVDEAHLLLGPEHADLYRLVYEARGAVVALFTATPLVEPPEAATEKTAPGRRPRILELVRGVENRDRPTDEGFVTWFMERPTGMFATVTNLDPTVPLPAVTNVPVDVEPLDERVPFIRSDAEREFRRLRRTDADAGARRDQNGRPPAAGERDRPRYEGASPRRHGPRLLRRGASAGGRAAARGAQTQPFGATPRGSVTGRRSDRGGFHGARALGARRGIRSEVNGVSGSSST